MHLFDSGMLMSLWDRDGLSTHQLTVNDIEIPPIQHTVAVNDIEVPHHNTPLTHGGPYMMGLK